MFFLQFQLIFFLWGDDVVIVADAVVVVVLIFIVAELYLYSIIYVDKIIETRGFKFNLIQFKFNAIQIQFNAIQIQFHSIRLWYIYSKLVF